MFLNAIGSGLHRVAQCLGRVLAHRHCTFCIARSEVGSVPWIQTDVVSIRLVPHHSFVSGRVRGGIVHTRLDDCAPAHSHAVLGGGGEADDRSPRPLHRLRLRPHRQHQRRVSGVRQDGTGPVIAGDAKACRDRVRWSAFSTDCDGAPGHDVMQNGGGGTGRGRIRTDESRICNPFP